MKSNKNFKSETEITKKYENSFWRYVMYKYAEYEGKIFLKEAEELRIDQHFAPSPEDKKRFYEMLDKRFRNKKCPKCGRCAPQYSHGKTQKNNARYRCNNCKKTYVLIEPRYTEEFKKSAVRMYLEGNSGRKLSKILGIGKSTIWVWLKKYNEKTPQTKK